MPGRAIRGGGRHRISGTGEADQVGVTGLRPSPLPHHRTSGCSHPAVGAGGRHRSASTTSAGVPGVIQSFHSQPAACRRQPAPARRPPPRGAAPPTATATPPMRPGRCPSAPGRWSSRRRQHRREWCNQFGEVYDEYVPPAENERAWFDLGLFNEDYDRPEDTPWCDTNFYEFGNVGVVYDWKEGDWTVSFGPFSCGDNEDDDPENNEGSCDNWP